MSKCIDKIIDYLARILAIFILSICFYDIYTIILGVSIDDYMIKEEYLNPVTWIRMLGCYILARKVCTKRS